MSEPLSTEAYKGVRDFYPADWATLQAVFLKIRETLRRFGYEEYNASPLERAELYESKGNEEIVNDQTYTFIDRGERKVTLRPEMTPTLARMVAAKRRELTLPLRWFSIPNVFRYERPQRGRLREHYQLNVDLVGVKDVKADGEIVVLAHTLLTSFGATNDDFIIRLNSRTLLDAAAKAAGLNAAETKAYLKLLDRKSKITSAEFTEALKAITATDPLALVTSGDERILEEKNKLDGLLEAFRTRGMSNVVFDPSIVRGFDYYTGVVFEIFDTDPSNPRSIFGGGRYDDLVSMFGGEPIPAIGFGMGDVTLIDFLTTHDLVPHVSSAPQIYLGTPKEGDIGFAQQAAEQLRAEGISVLVNITSRSLGDQIKEADKRGIGFFAAVGEDEQQSRTMRVKRLATGEERQLSLNDIAAYVAGR